MRTSVNGVKIPRLNADRPVMAARDSGLPEHASRGGCQRACLHAPRRLQTYSDPQDLPGLQTSVKGQPAWHVCLVPDQAVLAAGLAARIAAANPSLVRCDRHIRCCRGLGVRRS
jgi:hypothetical protein